MSTLLEQASLVMIPSGYKEDVVYSQIPTSGAGDLSFTRASNGTRINSAGLVEVCPWNLLEYSNAFNTAPWSMNVTSGQAGKDGQNNAWLLTKLTATTSDYYNSNVYNGDQTFTIYVKKESGKGFKLFPIGTTTTSVDVNLQTGAVLNQGAGITSTTVEAYSSTWWKISVALNMINSNYYIYVTDGAGTQIASSITIQDAQVNIGFTAKPYFPTTDRLNVPRLTYQNGGGGCPSLLLEKQSTNLALYSQQFDDGAWSKSGVTVTANDTTSPDGTQNAEKIEASGSGSISHSVRSFITTTSGSVYAFSLYAKKGTTDWIMLRHDNGGSFNFFNLNTGTKGTTSQASSTIESVGNGWYRLTVFHTGTGSNGPEIYIATADGTNEFTANGQTLYIWGAQYEASSYPTSYIPTTSSSATRVADACFKDSITSLIGQTEGTIFADIVRTTSTANDTFWVNISDGSTNDWIFMGTEATAGRFYVRVGNSVKVDEYPAFSVGRHKLALAYKSGQIAGYMDGVQLFTSTSTFTLTSLTRISLGPSSASSNIINTPAQVNEVVLFKTRLTNAELASLTTI